MVLTYAQRSWRSPAQLFRLGVEHWSALRKRLTRRYGTLAYIQTWEIHRTGWPHVNVLVGNWNLCCEAEDDAQVLRDKVLRPAARAVGFGKQVFVQPMHDAALMANYLTKLASELTGAAVKNQIPINAPPHFRRLRASQGLLPKPHKDEEITGRLVRCPVDRWHDAETETTVPELPTSEPISGPRHQVSPKKKTTSDFPSKHKLM